MSDRLTRMNMIERSQLHKEDSDRSLHFSSPKVALRQDISDIGDRKAEIGNDNSGDPSLDYFVFPPFCK